MNLLELVVAYNVSRIDSLEFDARLLNTQRAEFAKRISFQNFVPDKQSICPEITQTPVALAHLRLTVLSVTSINLFKIKTNMKKLLYRNGGVWLGLVLTILGSTSNSQESAPQTYRPKVGERHVDFCLPQIGSSKPVALSDFRGTKVLLMHFASW